VHDVVFAGVQLVKVRTLQPIGRTKEEGHREKTPGQGGEDGGVVLGRRGGHGLWGIVLGVRLGKNAMGRGKATGLFSKNWVENWMVQHAKEKER